MKMIAFIVVAAQRPFGIVGTIMKIAIAKDEIVI